jgi:predicted HTH domain antitoxin
MAFHLDIPESVAASMRLPLPEAESHLREELAVALYSQKILSFGKAGELAGKSRFAFAEQLARRGISRHYGETDLAQDAEYARRQ